MTHRVHRDICKEAHSLASIGVFGVIRCDSTVLTCWDADRLDLGRVGITPKAIYLCTDAAQTAESMTKANRHAQSWRDIYDAKHDRN